MVGRAAERFRRVEQGRVGRQQGDPAAATARDESFIVRVGPVQGLGPVQSQAQQTGGDAGRRDRAPGGGRQGGQDRPGQFVDRGDAAQVRQGLPGGARNEVEQFAAGGVGGPAVLQRAHLLSDPSRGHAQGAAHFYLARERVEAAFQAQEQTGHGAA